jgi:tetratricopeptide (TPR) repeat protein
MLALASAHRHMEHYDHAIRLYRNIVRGQHISAYERAQALLGEIESLRRVSRVQLARRRLTEVKEIAETIRHPGRCAKVRAVASVIEAGILRAAGNLPAAIAGYEDALRFCKKCRDLETHLEARLWYADVLRTAGRFHEARQQLGEITEESRYYTRKFTKGWVPFVTADVSLAMADLVAARKAIQTARRAFQTSGNTQGQAWVELLSGVLARVRGKLSVAEARLRTVRDIMRRATTPLALLAVRLELERAELARARGEDRKLQRCLRRAQSLAKSNRHFGQRPAYLRLHCKFVAIEWARQKGRAGVAEALLALAADYDNLGFSGCAARARVAAWLAEGDSKPPSGLTSECRRYGRDWELGQIKSNRPSDYPILLA